MIYQYIKANPKVAEHLGIATQRLQFPDGNYLLWKFDLMPLGGNNDDTLRMIGGVGMSSDQLRNEQRGLTVTKLPEAFDERFKMPSSGQDEEDQQLNDAPIGGSGSSASQEESAGGDENAQSGEENGSAGETPSVDNGETEETE